MVGVLLNMVKRELLNGLTLSTALTLGRIFLIPFVILSIMRHEWNVALCLFVVAAITDILDGACARLFDEHTVIGAYLDPIADKLLILSCYGSLAYNNLPSFVAPAWLVSAVFVKEIALVLGALCLSSMQTTFAVRPTWLGKGAMLAQTISVFWLLLTLFTGRASRASFIFLHQLVLFFVIASFMHYVYKVSKGTRLWYFLKKSL